MHMFNCKFKLKGISAFQLDSNSCFAFAFFFLLYLEFVERNILSINPLGPFALTVAA